MTEYNADTALKFARQHDWGRDAYLDRRGMIANLHDIAVDVTTGETIVATARVPATIPALRAFGEY